MEVNIIGKNNYHNLEVLGGKEKIAKGLSIQTIVTALMGILEIVYFSIMSRLLNKTDFGYFATITAIVAIFYSISEAGLGSAIIQKKEDSVSHISTAFSLATIFGSMFSILLFILAPYLSLLISDGGITMALRIMSCMLLFNSLNSVANGILSRTLSFKTIGTLQISAYSLSIIISIFMAIKNFGFYSLVANAIVYPFILCISYYSMAVKIPRFSLNKHYTGSILKFGGWLTGGVILNNVSNQIDKLMMPRLMSVQALGAYNRPAGFISTITAKINGIFDTVLFPMLSKFQDDKDSIRSIFFKAISILNPFSVLLASAFIFNASLIVRVFFGDQWLDLVPIMQIISITTIFSINGRLVDCFFRSINLVKLAFYIRLLQLIFTIIGVYVGCKHGLYGLAISIVLINITVIIGKVFILCNKINAPIGRTINILLKSLKLMIPYILLYLGINYLTDLSQDIKHIVNLLIFILIAIFEYVIYPPLVGLEYTEIVLPYLRRLFHLKGLRK